ncbi:uncharacterized protein LOC108034426 [Drosophila biarmipes]|uniref:uncharacterized protein LOC108034426 n=1 Tax=Drosophila biarmipes TaxID=125945 RepID=UPI0021CC6FBB|nr:uncharacterized protein LOC108034426 [Drosophila biarmipes]
MSWVIFSYVTFTNLKCGTKDIRFSRFEKCYIKAVNRTHKYIDLHVNLYQLPLDNLTVKVKLMRYDHGYKPFFIDITIDGCRFLKYQRNPVIKLLYATYKNNSNVNHTCPFNHDLIVDHLWTGNIDMDFMKHIPIMSGDYGLFTEWYSYNIVRAFVKIYLRITEGQI